jgi:hypothetical protein
MRAAYALPAIRARVGDAPIDFFGWQPGWILLNELHYAPRPMPITFGAANAALRRMNEDFLRDPARAPRFVLARLSTIERRVVSLDDGLALGALLDSYHPVATSGDLVLLERNAAEHTVASAIRPVVDERDLAISESLALPRNGSGWVWLEVDVRPSLLGRLRAAALRPARLRIELGIEGRDGPDVRDHVASMGSSGFLISPLLEWSGDLVTAYERGASALPAVRAVRFLCDPAECRFFEPRIHVRVREGAPPS